MQFNKKMSKAGAVTIPSALRRAAGIEAGEKMSVQLQEDGSLLLKRTQGSCILCGSEDSLVTHNGRLVCGTCVTQLQGKVAGGQA